MKKIEIVKQVAGCVAKFCVAVFFGAVAGHVSQQGGFGKVETGIVTAGATLVGLAIGEDASDYVGNGIDKWNEKYGAKVLTADDVDGGE